MHVERFTEQAAFVAAHDAPVVHERSAVQRQIARQHRWRLRYSLPGFCKMCNQPVGFKVDRRYGAARVDGVWVPNWRERLVCPRCRLVNRQRALGWLVGEEFARIDRPGGGRPRAYMMEQVSPFFAKCVDRYAGADWVGSEYLGSDLEPGAVRDGVRHEDAERLSFGDGELDLVVSSDVLEHVSDPERALAEVCRVLAPGGRFVLAVPFNGFVARNTVRASVNGDGELVHHEPAEYHHNPIDAAGSLVFTGFGWELVEQMRRAGLQGVEVVSYWSLEYGHLGDAQPLLVGGK